MNKRTIEVPSFHTGRCFNVRTFIRAWKQLLVLSPAMGLRFARVRTRKASAANR